MRQDAENALYELIYDVVAQVPSGMVATYGDIAFIVGRGSDARLIGSAMGALPANRTDVPWHRIVAKAGTISTRGLQQRDLLEAENVAFDAQGRVVMTRHHWQGPSAEWASSRGMRELPPRDDLEQQRLF